MTNMNNKNAAVKMYTDAAKAITDFDLQARLDRAMRKAGATASVTLRPTTLAMSYDDAEGIEIDCENWAIQARAANWVQKALDAAGVRLTRTGGSWGRPPQAIGPCFTYGLDESTDGEMVVVVISMCSIGE